MFSKGMTKHGGIENGEAPERRSSQGLNRTRILAIHAGEKPLMNDRNAQVQFAQMLGRVRYGLLVSLPHVCVTVASTSLDAVSKTTVELYFGACDDCSTGILID